MCINIVGEKPLTARLIVRARVNGIEVKQNKEEAMNFSFLRQFEFSCDTQVLSVRMENCKTVVGIVKSPYIASQASPTFAVPTAKTHTDRL